MAPADALKRLVELIVSAQRGVVPGEAAVFTCDGAGGDVPLV